MIILFIIYNVIASACIFGFIVFSEPFRESNFDTHIRRQVGLFRPSIGNVKKVADYFGVIVDDLLAKEKEET